MKNLALTLAIGLSMAAFTGCDDGKKTTTPPAASAPSETKAADTKVTPVESEADKASKAAETAAADVKSAAEEAKDAVKETVEAAGEGAKDIADKTGEALKEAADKAESTIEEIGSKTGAALKEAADKTEAAVEKVGDKAGEALKGAAEKADEKVSDLTSKATDALGLEKKAQEDPLAASLKNKKFALKKVNETNFDGSSGIGAPWIEFGDGLSITGKACNNFRGIGKVADGRIKSEGPLASTRMACPNEELNKLENQIFKMFGEGANISLKDNTLVITHGDTIFTFEEAK